MKRLLLALSLAVTACGAATSESVPLPPPPSPAAHESVPAAFAEVLPPSREENDAAREVPAGPPYDLAADLGARTRALRQTLGEKTRFETVEGVFLLASPSGVVGSPAAVARKALVAYFNGRFARHPARAVAVLLFDEAKSYEAYCKATWSAPCMSPYGFYSPGERVVVLNAGPGIGTLTHELVHPIVEADFPAAPDWLNEGIASLYEAFFLPRDGEIRGAKNFRHAGLLASLRAKDAGARPSLRSLFGMSDRTFRGDAESANYATARYFCQWMDGQNKLWPFYQAWRDGFASDPTGQKAFEATMGKSPAELDEAWATWVRRL